MRIAHNLIIDHFRRVKQLNTVSNDDYESDLFNSKKLAEATVEDHMIKKQIQKDIRKLISQLPEDQREVVILRHYSGPVSYTHLLISVRRRPAIFMSVSFREMSLKKP